MNKTATMILILMTLVLLGSAGLALSDDDEDSDDDDHNKRWSRDAKPGVVSALQQQYLDECGSPALRIILARTPSCQRRMPARSATICAQMRPG